MDVWQTASSNSTQEETPLSDSSGRPSSSSRRQLRTTLFFQFAVLVAIPLIALIVCYQSRYHGLTEVEAIDLAQVGRNLLSGRGFSTFFLRPAAIAAVSDPMRQPDVVHGPIYPLILAVAFGMFGVRDAVAAGVSSLFYLLSVPLVYLLGVRIFPASVARFGSFVYSLNVTVLNYAISGQHVTVTICLMLLLLLALHRIFMSNLSRQARTTEAAVPLASLAASGVLVALLYLTDPVFAWLIPAVLAITASSFRKRRLRRVLVFLIPLLVLAGPWMFRNASLTRNPVFGLRGNEIWIGTAAYPGTTVYRTPAGERLRKFNLVQSVLTKVFIGLDGILHTLPNIAAYWIPAFFLPSLFYRLKNPVSEALRVAAIQICGVLVFGMILFSVPLSPLICLVPFTVLIAAAFMFHALQDSQSVRVVRLMAYGMVAFATIYPLVNDLTETTDTHTTDVASAAQSLTRRMRPDEVVISDQPWAVAWYTDRPALWIPADDKYTRPLCDRLKTVRWLFLTEQSHDYSLTWQYLYDALSEWTAVYRQARRAGASVPQALVIDAEGRPALSALDGFISIPPAPEMPPGFVVARAGDARPNAASSTQHEKPK